MQRRNGLMVRVLGLALLLGMMVASPATAGSVYAVSDATNRDGTSHAFFLPPDRSGAPGTYYQAFKDLELTFDGSSWSDSSTAVLSGQIIQTNGKTVSDPAAIYNVEMHFIAGQSFADWSWVSGHTYKNENGTASSDYEAWRFFTLDKTKFNQLTRELTSGPGADRIALNLYKPEALAFQVGIGASMKHSNKALGGSTWITHDDNKGDVNIELTAVPTPTAISGLAMMGLIISSRRRRA